MVKMVKFMLCLFIRIKQIDGWRSAIVVMVVKTDLLEEVTFEQRYEKQELVSLEDTWKKSSLGRGNCTNKNQEAGVCLVCCENC